MLAYAWRFFVGGARLFSCGRVPVEEYVREKRQEINRARAGVEHEVNRVARDVAREKRAMGRAALAQDRKECDIRARSVVTHQRRRLALVELSCRLGELANCAGTLAQADTLRRAVVALHDAAKRCDNAFGDASDMSKLLSDLERHTTMVEMKSGEVAFVADVLDGATEAPEAEAAHMVERVMKTAAARGKGGRRSADRNDDNEEEEDSDSEGMRRLEQQLAELKNPSAPT